MTALAAMLPWIVLPLIAIARMAHSRRVRDESPDVPAHAPSVSVIVPARNEARNIEHCLRCILQSAYPALEVIIVDDHSSDDTRAIAQRIASTDGRVCVLANPDLPDGWFGKQWACFNGANTARGDMLIFIDADTCIAPDLIVRSVNGMLRTGADLYSVVAGQEMCTFWERLIQPQVFGILTTRYGGTESVNRSSRAYDKIANGQYLMLRHDVYDALGGHAMVRTYVAEDLMLAQKVFAAGRKTVLVLGMDEIRTRMYTSLHELISGWRKNVYAGGRDAVPLGKVGQLLFPFLLTIPAFMQLVPVVMLIAALTGVISATVTLWAAVTVTALLLWWFFVYWVLRQHIWYAFLFPIGAAVMLYIMLSAIKRGSSVAWKGREYLSTATD